MLNFKANMRSHYRHLFMVSKFALLKRRGGIVAGEQDLHGRLSIASIYGDFAGFQVNRDSY